MNLISFLSRHGLNWSLLLGTHQAVKTQKLNYNSSNSRHRLWWLFLLLFARVSSFRNILPIFKMKSCFCINSDIPNKLFFFSDDMEIDAQSMSTPAFKMGVECIRIELNRFQLQSVPACGVSARMRGQPARSFVGFHPVARVAVDGAAAPHFGQTLPILPPADGHHQLHAHRGTSIFHSRRFSRILEGFLTVLTRQCRAFEDEGVL